jgi:outer membrane protein OmpA-like peptidoglycan-associated protein
MKAHKKSIISTLQNLALYTVVMTVVMIFSCPAQDQLVNTVVSLTGSVIDEATRLPITLNMTLQDKEGKKLNVTHSNAAENGTYYFTGLKSGEVYYVVINDPKYFKERFEIKVPNTDKYVEISHDFLIKPMVKGAKIQVIVPPFELNKSKLRFGSDDILESLVTSLNNNPNVKFQIVCFPDNDRDKVYNKTLTDDRCKSLKDYFISKGINKTFISVLSNSATDPKNPPPTEKREKGKRYIGTTYIVVTSY